MDRRPDARPGRPDAGATAALLDRYAARLPELPRAPARRRQRAASRRRPLPSLAWSSRWPSPPLRRLAARPGDRRRPPRSARPRPDLTLVTDARYDVQPTQRRVRVTVDLTATNHLKDTKTKRYYFDHAFLAVQPGTSGLQAHRGRRRAADGPGQRSRPTTYTLLRLDLGAAAVQRQVARRTGCASTSSTRAARRPATSAIGDSPRDVPGLGVRHRRRRRAARVTRRLPGRLRRRGRGRRHPGSRRPTTTGGTIFRTGPLAKPLDFFAYLVADRAGRLHGADREPRPSARTAVALTIRAWPDDPAWAERVGGLFERALPVLAEQIGLPWPRDEPLVVAGGGQPLDRRLRRACSTRGRAGSRSPTTPTTSWSSTRRPTAGSTAPCWPTAGRTRAFASYYAQRGRRRARGQGDRRRS